MRSIRLHFTSGEKEKEEEERRGEGEEAVKAKGWVRRRVVEDNSDTLYRATGV